MPHLETLGEFREVCLLHERPMSLTEVLEAIDGDAVNDFIILH